MKKNKISKNWINKQRRDTYVRQSKVDGYRARSAYKIKEIDEKFKIFKGGMSVIDIGAAPGSWSQYVTKVVRSGKIISIDLKEMENIDNTIQIKGDFTDTDTQNHIKNFLDLLYLHSAIRILISNDRLISKHYQNFFCLCEPVVPLILIHPS